MEGITVNTFTADKVTSKVGNMKVTQTKDSITVQLENSTLDDLKQSLINKLNGQVGNLEHFKSEIELLKIILDYENQKPTDWQNSVYATKASIQCSNLKCSNEKD